MTCMYLSWWGGNHCMFFFTLPLFVCIDLCYLNWCNQIRNPTWLLLQRVAKLVIGQGLFSQVRVLLTRSTACLDLISHTFCMKYILRTRRWKVRGMKKVSRKVPNYNSFFWYTIFKLLFNKTKDSNLQSFFPLQVRAINENKLGAWVWHE